MTIEVEDELVIGRLAEGAGRLAEDDEISRSHARVTIDSSGVCAIEDLGSTNGTFVNGLRVSAPHALSEGDTIELGRTTLVVQQVPQREFPGEPAEPPPPSAQPTTGAPVVPAAPAEEAVAEEAPAEEAPAEEAPAEEAAPPAEAAPLPFAAEPTAPPFAPESAVPPSVAEPTPPEPAPASPAPLSLHLEVDFVAHEAKIVLDDASEPVRLRFEDGAWRPAASPSSEKGSGP
jgi:hypothetical protein